MKQTFSILIIVLFISLTTTFLEGQILYNDVGHIPQSCQVDWTNAGLLPGTSFNSVDVYVVTNYGAVPNDGQDDHSAIMDAINAAQATTGLTVVYFPSGTYNVNSTISLSRTGSDVGYSEIVLQGAGSDWTILQFTVGSTNDCINVYGVESGDEYGLTNIVTKGSTQLVRSDLLMFNVNDWIHLCEENFPYGGGDPRFVGQITQLSAINYGAGQATMKDEASKEYRPEYNLWIQKLYPIMNVGIENLKIQRMDQDPVTYEEGNANISFNIAVNCWVRGVESDNTTYNHLEMNRCSHIEISGNYVHHARSYGEYDPPFGVDGTGYGMTISYSSTNCLIVNNIWRKLRHAMTIGLGANCNVFDYNYSREQDSYEPQMLGDICLHGRYPYANLFEQNVVCQISADDTHKKNGPYNAFLRNWVVVPPIGRIKLHGPIWLHDAPNSGVLGCETWMGPGGNPIDATGSTTSLSVDIYGRFNGAFRSHAYMTAYESETRLNASAMADVSYYYSSRPEYLDMSYTWPSLGPNYTTSCSQSIPAKDRYGSSKKTYLPEDKKTQWPWTYSGDVSYNQTWFGTHTLTGNVRVLQGVTLTIQHGTTVNIPSGYKIYVEGTLIIEGQASQHVIIDGLSYPRIGYSNAMIDIKDGATADIQYADFVNSPYELIIRNSADCTVANSTFTNFGFDSGSRAITAYNSTGPVTISNCSFTGSGQSGYGVYAKNTSTNVNISGNTFNSCRIGIRCYSSDAFITSNTIQNSYYYGIQSDNVTYDAEYRDNTISADFTSYGIYLNSSSPYLMYNYIHDSKVLINSGSPEFATPYSEGLGHRGYNTIANASAPLIKVQNYSSVFMGYYGGDWEDGGYNSIYETDLPHIYAVNHSSVMADNNYWGSESPANAVDGTSSISDENPLSTNPNPLAKKIATDGFVLNWENLFHKETSTQDDKNDEKKFNDALAAGFKSNYVPAKEILKDIIDTNSSSKYPPLAVVMYHYFTKKELDDEKSTRDNHVIEGELTSLLNELKNKSKDDRLRPFGLKFSALEGALDRDYDTMIAYYDQLINEYPNSIHELTALYDEIAYYIEIKNDLNKAKKLISRMDSAYPEEELTFLAHILIGENIKLPKLKYHQQPESLTKEYIPAEFKLYPAFPNPFNPITSINYNIPEDVHVELKVYNVAGQELAILVNEKKMAGSYTITWSGENIPSGIYFYRIKAGNFVKTCKMTLLK